MSNRELIEHPKIIREQLVRNQREARLLRKLFKLSMAAHQEQRDPEPSSSPRQTVVA